MKNIIYSLFTGFISLFLFNSTVCEAQSRVIERLYVSTDRGAYVAGEVLWLSVYCFDISKDKDILSDLSNVAYIEIHNSVGVVITAKIALNEGRGNGRLELPPTLPTGNYRLIGYTKHMLNEEKVDYFDKVISIYNTLSSDRVPGNVQVNEELFKGKALETNSANTLSTVNKKNLDLSFGENGKNFMINSSFPMTIKNIGKEKATFNIAIVKVDSIPSPVNPLLSDYMSGIKDKRNSIIFVDKYTPEYEGEIIRGKITYEGLDRITEKTAFLSAVNGISDIYTSPIDSSGNIAFFTNSIFGDGDIVLEVPKTDTNSKISFEIFDPFVKPGIKPIPELFLSKRLENSLNERGIDMQIEKRFRTDTLFENNLKNRDPLLKITPMVYLLDDYTRFSTMPEVILEYVSELRFRKSDGTTDLQVRWEDAFRSLTYSKDNSLVIIDGVPVFDHKRVYDYDPLKVRSLSVYGSEFNVGVASFSGLVALRTYKGNFPGFTFNKNVRIMGFQGAVYPCRFTAKELVSSHMFPDVRNVLFWDPNITLVSGDSVKLECYTPSNPGTYEIKIEGIDKDGASVFYKTQFVVNQFTGK